MRNFFSGAGKTIQFIFGLVFIIGGIFYLTKDTSSLRPVDATVVSTAEKSYTDESSSSYEINYQYQVDRNTYTGSYTSAVNKSVGDVVLVYYDPKSPSESYYTQHQTITWGLTSLVFGLILDGSVFWGASKKRAAKENAGVVPEQEPKQE
jgi:hypothetical protein